jgi:signal transduction histidine kinase
VSVSRSFKFAPIHILATALAVGLAAILAAVLLACQPAWLGLDLAASKEPVGAVVRSSQGPASDIPAGTRLIAVSNAEARMELLPFDLIVEPDGAMGSFANYRRFLERQDRLAKIQSSSEIVFHEADGRKFTIQPSRAGRPPGDLPVDFWVQCAVGLVAWLVSAAVFAFRPGEPSARYLLLSGAATLIFAPAAATYTTRELAVSGPLLQWACDLNFFGGSLFAASFVGLLLVYPRRIAPRWVGPGVVALFVLWFIAQQLGLFESMTFARRFLVMLGVCSTFGLAAVHWRISRRDPLARAKLQWFLLSWLLGTSVFAFFILLPQTFGIDTSPIQGYAFLLFLLVYGGLALGILKYRLFDLGAWWRRVILWSLAVLLLVLLDLFFLYGLHLSVGTSLAVALLISGILWVPFRAWLWSRLSQRKVHHSTDFFQQVVDVALAPLGEDMAVARWQSVLSEAFQPLEIIAEDNKAAERVELREDGLMLRIPPVGHLPGLRLSYARGGRTLFSPRDASLAGEMTAMLRHAFAALAAHKRGAAEERRRIARDIHDNIGAQLLAALHSESPETKDSNIRNSLTDLRTIINHESKVEEGLDATLSDLRSETAERLEALGIELRWSVPEAIHCNPPDGLCHALRSVIREAVSNTIRHAGATRLTLTLAEENRHVRLEVSDNGRGFIRDEANPGHGLANMRSRIEALDGSFRMSKLNPGTKLIVEIPLTHRQAPDEDLPNR